MKSSIGKVDKVDMMDFGRAEISVLDKEGVEITVSDVMLW